MNEDMYQAVVIRRIETKLKGEDRKRTYHKVYTISQIERISSSLYQLLSFQVS